MSKIQGLDGFLNNLRNMTVEKAINGQTVHCPKCQSEVSVDTEKGLKCPHCGNEFKIEINESKNI